MTYYGVAAGLLYLFEAHERERQRLLIRALRAEAELACLRSAAEVAHAHKSPGRTKLTPDGVRSIRAELERRVPLADIARAHGVNANTVWRIQTRRSWWYVV